MVSPLYHPSITQSNVIALDIAPLGRVVTPFPRVHQAHQHVLVLRLSLQTHPNSGHQTVE